MPVEKMIPTSNNNLTIKKRGLLEVNRTRDESNFSLAIFLRRRKACGDKGCSVENHGESGRTNDPPLTKKSGNLY